MSNNLSFLSSWTWEASAIALRLDRAEVITFLFFRLAWARENISSEIMPHPVEHELRCPLYFNYMITHGIESPMLGYIQWHTVIPAKATAEMINEVLKVKDPSVFEHLRFLYLSLG